ncbi:MAG TPA: MBL fold metallo-hydrolase [Gemmatimonadaceae bacterium]|nr:MBL fold metallo-hydrolase [Gemmatimonadaceae bacterium]
MIIRTYTVGAFQENCYLVIDESTRRGALVDPGAEGDRIVDAVEQSGATLDAIWVTHGHVDHVGAIAAVKRRWEVPVYLNALDEPLYRIADRQAAMYGIPFESPPPADCALTDGATLTLGDLRFTVMHAPGHSPGLCVIHGEGAVFAGDLLFAGSIGRTDLPLSDGARMRESLARVQTLDDATVVYPGHGPATTIGDERRSNPFLTGAALVPVRQ